MSRAREARPSDVAEQVWLAALTELAEQISAVQMDLWVSRPVVAGELDGALALSAPVSVRGWFERRYGDVVAEVVESISDYDGIVLLVPDEEA